VTATLVVVGTHLFSCIWLKLGDIEATLLVLVLCQTCLSRPKPCPFSPVLR